MSAFHRPVERADPLAHDRHVLLTTGTTRTSTGGGGGAGLRPQAVASRSAAATSVRRDFTPAAGFPHGDSLPETADARISHG